MTQHLPLDRSPLQYGLLVVALFVFHFPQSSTLVWDDVLLVGLNPWRLNDWTAVWQQSLWTGIPGEHTQQWYRPLMATHLLLDQWLFGDSIISRQWVNVAWFGSMLLLLRTWCHRALSMSSNQTFWMALLLICHPFSMELTQFIAARNDTMVLSFIFGFGLSLKSTPTNSSFITTTLFAFLALTSKESAALWLGLIVCVQWSEIKQYWLSLGCAVAGWFLLKSMANLSPLSLDIDMANAVTTMIGSGAWFGVHLSPLAAPPTGLNVYLSSLCLITVMIWISKTTIQRLGTVLFFIGSVLATLSIQQSHSLGFRYAWIPLLGQVIWLVGLKHTLRNILQVLCGLGFSILNFQVKPMWIDNTTFWDSAHAYQPTQHTACGAFMNNRPWPDKALPLLYQSLQKVPMHHCCAQSARYPIELNDAKAAIELGTLALQNGCPNIPEIHSPLALAYALEGQWTLATEHIKLLKNDPFGYSAIIEVAWGLQNLDESALDKWAAVPNSQHPEWGLHERKQALKEQARFLLEQANHSR